MYKKIRPSDTAIKVNEGYVGETIEQKVRRIVNNKAPITDGAPLIYTERKDGLKPEYDIRTDRWELAVDAMDAVSKAHLAKREGVPQTMGEQAQEGMKKEEVGKPESTQGTDLKK